MHVGALFDLGNLFLRDPESFRRANLCHLARTAQSLQGHLLGDQLAGALFDLAAAGGRQALDDVVYVPGETRKTRTDNQDGGKQEQIHPAFALLLPSILKLASD